MAVTTRAGKQIIDPPTPFVVEDEERKNYYVVEASIELMDESVKEA